MWPFVVMVEFAQRSTASLVSVTTNGASGADRAGQRPLDDLLRRRAHYASARVLSTLTCRNSADGQPWPTGALCPGWALPQFMAPKSRHVDGPPTAVERAPEVGGQRLVGDVAQLPGQFGRFGCGRTAAR